MTEEHVPNKQRNKIKIPEEELSEVEISNVPEKEFKVRIIKIIEELESTE